jgi:hypothetical protein
MHDRAAARERQLIASVAGYDFSKPLVCESFAGELEALRKAKADLECERDMWKLDCRHAEAHNDALKRTTTR